MILHPHDEEQPDNPDQDQQSIWAQEIIRLRSVGIDIGSTTTHLTFSDILLGRLGVAMSSRFQPLKRDIVHESRVMLTPFTPSNELDIGRLSAFISQTYDEAGIAPQAIDTGAVICTGEAARKENAEAVISLFAEQTGKFVCATAGPKLEAMMAAQGSGAVRRSRDGTAVMNVDVGGGTTKVAIAKGGSIVDTVAIGVGARLITMDENSRLVKMDDGGRSVAHECGHNPGIGDRVEAEAKDQIARVLARVLFDLLEGRHPSPLGARLMLTPPLSYCGKIDALMFSGGVSEYIYGYEDRDFGDLGIELAREIRHLAERGRATGTLEEPLQRLRATAIGASQYSVQVSGSTIFVSNNALLPLRNLPVLSVKIGRSQFTAESVRSNIEACLQQCGLAEGDKPVALMFDWRLEPSYESFGIFGRGIRLALENSIRNGIPIVLVFNADIGKSIGHFLSHELAIANDLISIDGIDLQEFDYIDIGKELSPSGTVPVMIKSLVFR